MLNLTSATVVANGTKLHYYRTGGNKPPLVLVHGITDDGLCWSPVAEVLAADYDVVMVDARGHGKSDAPDDGYSLQNLATELARLIQILDLKTPILLGHSMGAITSLILAGLFPELPRAILLEDPPPFWVPADASSQNEDFSKPFVDWILSNKRKTRDELLAEGKAHNPNWTEAEFQPWADAKHRFSYKITALAHPQDINSLDFQKIFKRISCPTKLMSADKALGAVSSEEDIKKLKEYVPQLQVVHIDGAGHNIRRDQFNRYIQVIQHFIDDLPKR